MARRSRRHVDRVRQSTPWQKKPSLALCRAIASVLWPGHPAGTAPISWSAWLFMLPFALGMLVLEELRKWFVRRQIG